MLFNYITETIAMGLEENMVAQPPEGFMMYAMVDALLEAARYDDIDDLQCIESSGVSLDSKDLEGRTALHMASANGHLDMVDYLINRGVDVNACNAERNTPLHWACLNGHKEVIRRLILGGASISSLNSHERTPMDEAIAQGKMEAVDAINEAAAHLELSGVTSILHGRCRPAAAPESTNNGSLIEAHFCLSKLSLSSVDKIVTH
ncbi:ankyrin repeat-containing protein P16F5.05c [Andrographis paniculata]|uniref:ankyrin repeat-containing protein P16F5.05c n=1 Tax=Andrographis paniculata TaxID=175694 RepID=UPI0021E9AB84|nr:ankyrin repeat-containing protein P16F5.05c [Andrographis paniculata]